MKNEMVIFFSVKKVKGQFHNNIMMWSLFNNVTQKQIRMNCFQLPFMLPLTLSWLQRPALLNLCVKDVL